MVEKRNWARQSMRAEGEMADLLGRRWIPVSVIDFSPAGLSFLCPEPASMGSERALQIWLPLDGGNLLRLNVRIANCSAHKSLKGFRLGVEYIEPDAAASALIERMLH